MNRFITNITNTNKQNVKISKKDTDIAICVLSAGVGARIKSYEPRCLLKVGHQSLLEHQISLIQQCFSSPEIISVVGFEATKVIKKFNNNKNVRLIENQLYENTNSSESIRLAFNSTNKDKFLFMHGDLYFNKETLLSLDYSKSFLIVDSQKRFDNREVGITIGPNRKASILSYGLDTKWCQIAFITGKEMNIANNVFSKFENHHKKMLSFEVLNKIILSGGVFTCYEPEDMKILEIDRIGDIT